MGLCVVLRFYINLSSILGGPRECERARLRMDFVLMNHFAQSGKSPMGDSMNAGRSR